MTLTWKPIDPKYGEGDSAFGINFREAFPEIAKQLSDASGMYQHGKTCVVLNYEYKAKVVNAKSGGTFVFVERKAVSNMQQPATEEKDKGQKAESQPNGEYEKRQSEIRQAHLENMAASKAHTDALNHLSSEMAAFAATVARILQERTEREQKLMELLEATLKSMPLFKTADQIQAEKKEIV